MKKFNYETLFIASHGNSSKLLALFYSDRAANGNSFMLNPSALAQVFWASDRQKAEYIGLCSLRSYAKYLETGNPNLSIASLPPWVPLQVAQQNPLIKLTDKEIIFLKENI